MSFFGALFGARAPVRPPDGTLWERGISLSKDFGAHKGDPAWNGDFDKIASFALTRLSDLSPVKAKFGSANERHYSALIITTAMPSQRLETWRIFFSDGARSLPEGTGGHHALRCAELLFEAEAVARTKKGPDVAKRVATAMLFLLFQPDEMPEVE